MFGEIFVVHCDHMTAVLANKLGLASDSIGSRNQEHQVKHTNRLCGQGQGMLHFKAGGIHSNHCFKGLNADFSFK
jgi:hypothetical protein